MLNTRIPSAEWLTASMSITADWTKKYIQPDRKPFPNEHSRRAQAPLARTPAPLLPAADNHRLQPEPSDGTVLSKTSFIQKLTTRAGIAPADGCSTSAD